MLKIPKQKIVEKILKQTNLSIDELENKIQQKLKELSGLISEEGAAHIVANELGVSIFTIEPGQPVKIDSIIPGMRGFSTAGKIVRVFPPNTFTKNGSQGKVQSIVIADETGQIRCAAWHEATEKFASASEGDIIALSNVMSRDNQGRCELSINDSTEIRINPPQISIDSVAKPSFAPAKTVYIKDITKDTRFVSIVGTLVQAYPPAFFVPKDQRQEGATYALDDKKACVANFIIDDGTGTLRVAIFTDQLTQFLEHTVDELKKEDIWKTCKAKTLGHLVSLQGRVSFNEQFNRTEMTVQQIQLLGAQEALKALDTLGEVKEK